MKTQEIQLKDRPENVIDVVMTADASQLAEKWVLQGLALNDLLESWLCNYQG